MFVVLDSINLLRNKGIMLADVKQEEFAELKEYFLKAGLLRPYPYAVRLGFYTTQESMDVLWEKILGLDDEDDAIVLHAIRDSICFLKSKNIINGPATWLSDFTVLKRKLKTNVGKENWKERCAAVFALGCINSKNQWICFGNICLRKKSGKSAKPSLKVLIFCATLVVIVRAAFRRKALRHSKQSLLMAIRLKKSLLLLPWVFTYARVNRYTLEKAIRGIRWVCFESHL